MASNLASMCKLRPWSLCEKEVNWKLINVWSILLLTCFYSSLLRSTHYFICLKIVPKQLDGKKTRKAAWDRGWWTSVNVWTLKGIFWKLFSPLGPFITRTHSTFCQANCIAQLSAGGAVHVVECSSTRHCLTLDLSVVVRTNTTDGDSEGHTVHLLF